MNDRISSFLADHLANGPVLVIDADIVRENYLGIVEAMPECVVHYAVKANPEPAVLELLVDLGSSFDCASVQEIESVLEAGADAASISYGNTIKKERDIAAAFALGVRLFATDSFSDVEKIARAAPGAQVFCRILTDGDGAEWPLSRKFGCDAEMAVDVLLSARELGLDPIGVSFHVGSQMTQIDAWDTPLAEVARIFETARHEGLHLSLVNLGGGLPAKYVRDVPSRGAFGRAIMTSVRRHLGSGPIRLIVEPGRGLAADSGVIRAEVVGIARKGGSDTNRWVFLDVGKFGGLAETMDEAIRYRITTDKDGGETSPCVVAGPTCDSADVLYEKTPYELPEDLAEGDFVYFHGAGAYTATYSAVAFNGFPPLSTVVLPETTAQELACAA